MKFVLVLLVFQIVNYANAQNIVGLWQEGTPEVSSGFHNCYMFKNDGTFKFKTDEYFGLKRILSINGKYQVVNDTLILSILSTTEIVGGKFERSISGGETSDSWEIIEGEVKTFTLPKSQNEYIMIRFKKTEKSAIESFLLDNRNYYKVK